MFPCNSAAVPLRVPLQFRCSATQRNSPRNLRYFNSLPTLEAGRKAVFAGIILWTREISAAQRNRRVGYGTRSTPTFR